MKLVFFIYEDELAIAIGHAIDSWSLIMAINEVHSIGVLGTRMLHPVWDDRVLRN